MRPLFPGLDESKLDPPAQRKLAKAKTDFLRAKRDEDPIHAKFAGVIPHTNSRVFDGNGYQVVIVHNDFGTGHVDGPQIRVDERITGGRVYEYDELDEVVD